MIDRVATHLFLLLVGLVWFSAGAVAQEVIPREPATADVRFFLRSLEEIHPDPYSAFGGKIEFKRRAREIVSAVPDTGLTAGELRQLLLPLIIELRDGHTWLAAPAPGEHRQSAAVLPLEFGVVTDGLYVSRAAIGYEDLIGYRLASAGGHPTSELGVEARLLAPSENRYGAARTLSRALSERGRAQRLLRLTDDTLRVRLEAPSGRIAERPLPYEPSETWDWPAHNGDAGAGRTGPAADPIGWSILEPSGAGYLRLRSIEGREAFEEARGRADLPTYLSRYYDLYLGRQAPVDPDSALAGVPCFTETAVELLTAMRERGSRQLIVDVRGNGGGWSSLMIPLYVLLYGRRYSEFPFPDTWIDSASPQYLELAGWDSTDLARAWGPTYAPGDYRFDTRGAPQGDRTWEEYAASLAPLGCGLAERARRLEGRPLHAADVWVLTDSGTFSAAFHLAYTLWRLGAEVVGTPPAQSGNAYSNVVRVVLPNSGLRGSVSRSVQRLFPDDPLGGRVLMPDHPILWTDLSRFEFSPDAELLYALERMTSGPQPN